MYLWSYTVHVFTAVMGEGGTHYIEQSKTAAMVSFVSNEKKSRFSSLPSSFSLQICAKKSNLTFSRN